MQSNQPRSRDAREQPTHYIGMGDWRAFNAPIDHLTEAAEYWKKKTDGIQKGWLCWHVNERWTRLQVRLVREVGWTPIVGFDSQFDPPPSDLDAIKIDFNKSFEFELLWMHFPLEFAYKWIPRLAFWHSDLLCRLPVMKELSEIFTSIQDGSTAAVKDLGGRRNYLNFKNHRYWELAGCTTAKASLDQFDRGAGWWRHIGYHPSCPSENEKMKRNRHIYDHGSGIMYWKRHYGGTVVNLNRKKIEEGHCTSINFKNYKRTSPVNRKSLGEEIDLNYDLERVADKLDISHLL